MSKKLVLIDGHSILNRAYFGVPDLTNTHGLHTNAIYGFLNILFKILEEEKPEYLVVAFDVHAPTFRHKIFDAYKGTRKPMADELREQVPVMKEVLRAMNVVILEEAGLEADDILGTLAKRAEADGMEVSLVSGDRDLLQIASQHIKIRIPKTRMGKTEIEDYYAEDVLERYQVTPTQFIDVKALMGDSSDNIPGVPKVGEKTATYLIVEYGTLDNVYSNIENITKNSVRESLRENKDLADLSKTLVTIKIDCDIQLTYEDAKAENYYTQEAYALFKKLEFKNMLNRFENAQVTSQIDVKELFHIIEEPTKILEILKKVEPQSEIGLLILTEKNNFLGLAISLEEKTYFHNIKSSKEPEQMSLFSLPEEDSKKSESKEDEIKKAIYKLSQTTKISTFDIKKQYTFLQTDNIETYFDILIGSYLLNPLKNDYDIEAIASEQLGMMIPGHKEVFEKKNIEDALNEKLVKVAEYYCYGAYVAKHAATLIKEKLCETEMDTLMKEIEMPLSLVLFDMEKEGIAVKRDELHEYGQALVARIEELESSIHEQAGVDFNVNSPKQLGEVLFETMEIPGGKKTKTGYSTAADILEKLAPDYPIIKDVLEYRGLAKLKSTYADGLANYIEEDNRIHSNFNQTITATGRISSTEPNLQNIPIRMELGRRIRKVFVPKENCVFMDADYSQIELRVLAHMSGDEQLIEAYRMEEDIHKITASKVFNTPFEEVTELQRRNAKAVNFGIVYGISSFGLSQDLSISKKKAAEYIEQYFNTYPKIKEFLDNLVAEAKSKGYITTMFGRRRPVPELFSSNFMQRSFGERIAMNSPIQGTAADIIKIAMIKVWKALKDAKLQSKLILQVHDELLIETVNEEVEQVRKILTENMLTAANLKVKLEVDLHTGDNWYEAK